MRKSAPSLKISVTGQNCFSWCFFYPLHTHQFTNSPCHSGCFWKIRNEKVDMLGSYNVDKRLIKGYWIKWAHPLNWLIKGVLNKVVQLFWGQFFDYVFFPFETSNSGMETLFTTLLNHQRSVIFINFLLLICMKTFENLMVFMLITKETLFTTLLNHQRFWWFSLIFAADLHENLWNLDGFHANHQRNFIYYPPESSKILMIFIDFCCWFAWQPLKSWWFSC